MSEAMTNWKEATEKELREASAPWPKSKEELIALIDDFISRQQDYGTCVYSVSIVATAAFHMMARVLGITGFQALCADLDVIRRTRSLKGPFSIKDYSNLLYPQYCDDDHFPSLEKVMKEPDIQKYLKKEAIKKLDECKDGNAHPDVIAHWQMLASTPDAAI